MHRKGGGLERHSPLYLECRDKCWSTVEYLLFVWRLKKRYNNKHNRTRRTVIIETPKFAICVIQGPRNFLTTTSSNPKLETVCQPSQNY